MSFIRRNKNKNVTLPENFSVDRILGGRDDRFEYLYRKLVKLIVNKYSDHIIIEEVQIGTEFGIPMKEFNNRIMGYIHKKHSKAEEPHPAFIQRAINEADQILLNRGFKVEHRKHHGTVTIIVAEVPAPTEQALEISHHVHTEEALPELPLEYDEEIHED